MAMQRKGAIEVLGGWCFILSLALVCGMDARPTRPVVERLRDTARTIERDAGPMEETNAAGPMERDARPRESNSRLVETISQPSRAPMPPSPSLSSPPPSYLTVHSSKYWTRLDSDLPEESDSTGLYHLTSSTTLFSQEDGMEFASKVHRERIVHLSAGCGRGKNRIATLSDGTKMCCRYRDVQWKEVRGEFYSYHFNNLLGLFNAPPATLLRVNLSSPQWDEVVGEVLEAGWTDHATIVVTLFVEDLEGETFPLVLRNMETVVTNNAMTGASPAEKERLLQWSDLVIFDFIVGHSDRIFNSLFNLQWNNKMLQRPVHNLLKTKERKKLLLFDNESGFWFGYKMKGSHYQLQEKFLKNLCIFRSKTIKIVRSLLYSNGDLVSASEGLEDYIKKMDVRSYNMVEPLQSDQSQEFETRLKLVLEQVDKCRGI